MLSMYVNAPHSKGPILPVVPGLQECLKASLQPTVGVESGCFQYVGGDGSRCYETVAAVY